MTTIEPLAGATLPDGVVVERLVPHPRLPWVAGLDAARTTVHVWGWESGDLTCVATVGEDAYGDAPGWDRMRLVPSAAWHPERALLVVNGSDGLAWWAPDGATTPGWAPPVADDDGAGGDVAFTPDGATLLVSGYERSTTIRLATGDVGSSPGWDTGFSVWPGGRLALSYVSDQSATHGLFTRIDPATGRRSVVDRALLLDVDGYETPVVSPDGRYVAIRGNAYGQTLQVFEMPSLRLVLSTTLMDESPGFPYPPEWLAELHSWSRHDIAFGDPGTVWVGTPHGTLVALDVARAEAVAHELPDGAPVTALAGGAGGVLVVATGGGSLRLFPDGSDRTAAPSWEATATGVVQDFLATTAEVPDDAAGDDGDLDEFLERLTTTDGREGLAARGTAQLCYSIRP
ncbi:hypothetical protein [Myceligenerans pegani]|uniref:WD40 repeat domain-containing protein n=1 Tax=Myceligenerans pegani TaxID=2776917 RepID=A0ABR9N181_9MICO|nr:hypothetical protein [Myceligenerans sp. TRM 65318]MBE1876772.1 hypothetical protein [Myceligenerans sp. TRM 65318]MBE3019043.1 hypothetical protein [Myceligenerans sp. TRM 65318]